MNQYLQSNHQRLSEFENWAQASFNEGDFESALEHASSGAEWSWDHHPGEFASAKLEKLLRRIGRKYASTEKAKSSVTLRPRVLHILTEAYGTEGRGFESLQPHQILHPALTDWHRTQMLKPLTVFVLNE